ncbi:MAG: hypothetical protein WBV82_06855 [Myxococcaceae bacterium]
MNGRGQIREGMIVRSADGAKLGRVALLGEHDFQVEKGAFFPREYVASYAEVAEIREDEVILNLDRTTFRTSDPGTGVTEPTVAGVEPAVSGKASPENHRRHEQQLEEVRHEQHERVRLHEGKPWEWEGEAEDRRLSGSGAQTIGVARETYIVDAGGEPTGRDADDYDKFREESVKVDEGQEVAKAWREHDVVIGKRFRQEEIRYSASDDDPSGMRREAHTNGGKE